MSYYIRNVKSNRVYKIVGDEAYYWANGWQLSFVDPRFIKKYYLNISPDDLPYHEAFKKELFYKEILE